MGMCLLYLRTSADDGRDKAGLPVRRRDYHAYAQHVGLAIMQEFSDDGVTLAHQTFSHDFPIFRGTLRKSMYFSELELVEAAGVEPASENVTGQEPTCVVQFMPQALPWNVRDRRSERTRNASR